MCTFRHFSTPFSTSFVTFVSFNPARDYLPEEGKDKKTVSFLVFSRVLEHPEVVAGRVESEKSTKSMLFVLLFDDY